MDAHPKRTLVFQILKIIIGIAVAVALIKFAFFPAQPADDLPQRTGDFTQPTVTVERGDIDNSLSLKATVVRDASVSVKSTAAGEVTKVYVNSSTSVNPGVPLIQVKHIEEPKEEDVPPAVTYTIVRAQSAGTVSIDVLKGQDVAIGDVIGTVQPATFHAQVSVTPDQLYSLQSLPKEGELAITNGPAPFPCTNLRTVTGAAASTPGGDSGNGKSDGGDGGSGNQSASPELQCTIPSDHQVFDGVTGKLKIAGANAKNVLIVPASSIEGRYKTGRVWLPPKEGEKPKAVSVQLGASDGENVQITGGLDEGQEILQYAPGSTKESKSQNGEG